MLPLPTSAGFQGTVMHKLGNGLEFLLKSSSLFPLPLPNSPPPPVNPCCEYYLYYTVRGGGFWIILPKPWQYTLLFFTLHFTLLQIHIPVPTFVHAQYRQLICIARPPNIGWYTVFGSARGTPTHPNLHKVESPVINPCIWGVSSKEFCHRPTTSLAWTPGDSGFGSAIKICFANYENESFWTVLCNLF